jgi:hypothetical protein
VAVKPGNSLRLRFILLLAVGALLRLLLVAGSPTPFGYVFDFYHEAIQHSWNTGSLPRAEDCWQCYHPPLFYLVGLAFYGLGRAIGGTDAAGLRALGVLPLACGVALAWACWALMRRFRLDSAERLLAFALVLAFPCLFISTFGVEADILVSALLAWALVVLVRLDAANAWRPAGRPAPWLACTTLGALAGLAAATKYNGLVALATAGVVQFRVLFHGLVRRRGAVRAIQCGLVILSVALALASWKYIDNARTRGTPMFANGWASQGFSVRDKKAYWGQYEFTTLRMGDLGRLAAGAWPRVQMTRLPFYNSVPTSLHAQAWGDMGFFSQPGRHGDISQPYPDRHIPPWLTVSVLWLGLLPTLLAVVGFAATLARRSFFTVHVFTAVTFAAYVFWFVSQELWALKAKYILFLLPAYAVYAVMGTRWVRRRLGRAAHRAVTIALVALAVLAHLWCLKFALG